MNSKAIKFLDAYDKSDFESFYGRRTETTELYEKVKKSRLTLLYGLSGTGKTSLVQCGLANKFSDDAWLPIFIRRGDNIITSLRKSVDENAKIKTQLHKSLNEALQNLYLDYFVPIILIFDQFEELFISGDKEEIDEFILILANILHLKIDCKVILIVREEYLAYFDNFGKTIPSIFDNRMRLERMRRHDIEKVICKITEATDKDKEIVSKMAENISDKKGNIELTHLQIYLDKLSRLKITSLNEDAIKPIGKLENLLGDFLEKQLQIIINELGNKELVWTILKSLITDDGTKKPVSINDIKTLVIDIDWNLATKCLDLLEKSRIIRNDSGYYELTHDSLATKIIDHLTSEEKTLSEVKNLIANATEAYKTTGALMGREQLIFIKNFENRLSTKLTDDQKEVISLSHHKDRKRRHFKVFLSIFIPLILLIFGGFEFHQNSDLNEKTRELKKQICSTCLAETSRLITEKSFDSALKKLDLAPDYCDTAVFSQKMELAKSMQKNYSQLINNWIPRIDTLEKNKEYDKAIITCDSILEVFQSDQVYLSKKQGFIKGQFEELTNHLGKWKKIPEYWPSVCEDLLKAESLKYYDSVYFKEKRYDTIVNYYRRVFDCKLSTNEKDSVPI